jgi:hypothetical protein
MWVAFFLKISATVARSNVGPMPQSILLKRVGIETIIVGGGIEITACFPVG